MVYFIIIIYFLWVSVISTLNPLCNAAPHCHRVRLYVLGELFHADRSAQVLSAIITALTQNHFPNGGTWGLYLKPERQYSEAK